MFNDSSGRQCLSVSWNNRFTLVLYVILAKNGSKCLMRGILGDIRKLIKWFIDLYTWYFK